MRTLPGNQRTSILQGKGMLTPIGRREEQRRRRTRVPTIGVPVNDTVMEMLRSQLAAQYTNDQHQDQSIETVGADDREPTIFCHDPAAMHHLAVLRGLHPSDTSCSSATRTQLRW